MMVRPTAPARGHTCHPLCAGAAAGYARLLAAHERAGRPLLTLDGEAYVRQFLVAAGPDDAIPGPFGPPLPHWDPDARRLLLGPRVLKVFRQPAPRQTTVLAAFAEQRWATHLDDPLPPEPGDGPEAGRQRLNETIRNLNRGLPAGTLRFHGDGTGEGAWWEYCRPSAAAEPGELASERRQAPSELPLAIGADPRPQSPPAREEQI